MNETEKLLLLETENERLRIDNEELLKILAQLKVTLNRLIDRYLMN